MPFAHMLFIIVAFLKMLFFLRCNSNFGGLVQLVISCLADVRSFIIFFMSWILVFTLLFVVAGTSMDGADYPNLPRASWFINTYRNSIGDV